MDDKLNTGLDVKRLSINLIFSVIAFLLNLFINFFITPYITMNFGAEAYGFVKLANDFASYASLLSIALNSMSSRFIMLKREHGEIEEACKYYTSITIANIALAFVLMVPAVVCVCYLERILEISSWLLYEVKIVFTLTFLNFLLNLVFNTFGNCYYLTNRLDIQAIKTAQTNIIRVVSIFLLFMLIEPKLSYVVAGTLIASLFLIISNIKYTKKLTPDLKLHIKNFEPEKVKMVLTSGIWNSITKLSQVFSSGLDLLITNLLLGTINMGYLSVAKTIPNLIVSFNATIANIFSPNLMQLYAREEKEGLKLAAKSSMRFMCLFVTIPTAILICMGTEFFQLWVPEQPADLINILSILTIINSCITGPIQPLYQIFTITNKVKQSSVVLVIYGFLSIIITYICLRTTNLGLYAVAGVSLIGSIIVALCYHLPFAAIYIGLPWYTFFPQIGSSVLSLSVVCVIGMVLNSFVDTSQSWWRWITCACIIAVIGFCMNTFIVLKRDERRILKNKILRKRG